jgi:ADP-ribose pyrophosphatase YjhB (NUDIX family)
MITCHFKNANETSLRHAVVDVLVLKDNKVLLVKRAQNFIEGGKWALVGGYMERDENLHQAVEREIFEETGYRVANITLLTIRHNPDRPNEDLQNISFVFFCNALEKEGQPDNESDMQQWHPLDSIPPLAFDHTQNVTLYLQYKRESFALPVFN